MAGPSTSISGCRGFETSSQSHVKFDIGNKVSFDTPEDKGKIFCETILDTYDLMMHY